MKPAKLRALALVIGLGLLQAALPASAQCAPGACLTNSAVDNRPQPTTVTQDDKGDVTFFASQSGQLPNVVFVIDNSTSMYELPYDVNPFPNSAWVTKGVTASPCGGTTTSCPTVAFSATAATCGSNTYFNSLLDSNGNPFSKSTVYPVPDPAFSTYFADNSVYAFMEWNTTAPGGTANGGPITFTPGLGTLAGTVSGTVGAACNNGNFTATYSGGSSNGRWTMSQAQRCQQCIDEVGYYIAPGSSTTDQASGSILFKGRFLNFFPPKFIIARKTLTDFISNQSSTPTPVRVGVVTYDPNNVGALDVPATTTGFSGRPDGGHFISAGMVPDCNVTNWTSAATQTQKTNLLTAVRGISWGSFSAPVATPLAETLFNVGQFLGGSNSYYTANFGAQWIKSEFTAPTTANKPLCVSCQVNAIVLITDGQPYGDNNLPQRFRNNTIQCPHATGAPDPCGVDESNGTPNLLDDVTNFLATNDLDNNSANGIQSAITFVIGLGLKVPLLDNAAQYGKTTAAIRADNAQDLQNAVTSAVVNIIARATAFSSTAIQTLEVGTGSSAYVPRFVPGSPTDANWDGHLFRFNLFNEFVAGVDKNGDGKLDSVFLVDKNGDIVTEDDQGAFHKLINGQPGAPAVPIWDAGAQLTATPAANRTIYTAVWDTVNSKWNTIPLPNWNGSGVPPSDFQTVENLLGTDGTNACAQIQASMATPIPAAYLSATGTFDRDHCAKAIIDYVRGFNILNELPSNPSVTANRAHMLGDIFHSSPVVVDPPVDQFICDLGLHGQCVSTLYQYDTNHPVARPDHPIPSAQYTDATGTFGAYEKYWRDHETRQRIVMVGANDGMIHAFDGGVPTTSPPTLNSGVGFRQVVYGDGTGNEQWAFIPPDQLPRLWLMMRDGHQLYMDGDIMVRDVWVDGVGNDKATASYMNQPLVKQDVEYHTIAIVSERQGGSHFVALDVTDTTTPKMLWIYPPPCSPEEEQFGQTWGQFSPRPPPIGPVMLQTTNVAGPANYGFTNTEERYAVFLNGGHSPYMNRGRIAAVLDAYRGTPLFVAKYNPGSTDPNDPALAMRFGFSATPSLVDFGTGSTFMPDGFFDTGLLGDEGGQIWTLRMAQPGHINLTSGLVDNWTFGRAYEPNSASTNDTRFHQPIYTIASATVQEETGWLRTFVGSGDRAHVRSQNGGDCRRDGAMTCINSGCSVNTSLTMDNGTNHYVSSFTSAAGSTAAAPRMAAPTQTQSVVVANACNRASVSETITVSGCPTAAMNFTENTLNFTCSGTPLACTEGAFMAPSPNANRNYTTTPPVGANTFTSVAVLAATGARTRTLNLPADADTYDTNRFTQSDLTDVSLTTANSSGVITSATHPAASTTAPGWVISYPTIDEKTVTSSTILGGCVLWNTLLPSGGTVGCASAGANTSTAYQADPFTGAPTCASAFISGTNYSRTITHSVLSPPPEPAAAVAIGNGGSSMRLSMLEVQPGAQEVTQTTVGTSTELLQMIYSLPLTYDQHVCRHVDATKCP